MTWSYQLDDDGAYVVLRDGTPAAMVALSATVGHHRLRMQQVVEAFEHVDTLAARLEALDDVDDPDPTGEAHT